MVYTALIRSCIRDRSGCLHVHPLQGRLHEVGLTILRYASHSGPEDVEAQGLREKIKEI